CSQYRTFTKCQYQLKAKIYHDGTYQIFYSQHHEHELLEDTRLPTDIRSNIRDLAMKGLTIGQIQKIMEPFVPFFEVTNIDNIFVCITTRQLLSTCKWSCTLAIDCTYKITSCELPLLIFGTSDINRRYFPMGLCLISTDETTKTFVTFLKGIQVWAATANHQPYTINVIMADGAPGLTAAVSNELPTCRRLMCWPHVLRKVREHRSLIKNKEKFLMVEKDIKELQLAFNDQVFFAGAKLMLEKWATDKDLNKFSQYFSEQWLSHLCYWYEGAARFTPSSNNGLESLNGRIKQHYTMRNKLPLAPFLQLAEKMLVDWSTNNVQQPFQLHLTINNDLDVKAYDWINKVDRNEILQLDAFTFVVPSKEPQMNIRSWINCLYSMTWSSYEHFKQWLGSARLLNYSNMLPPIFCSCKYGLKEYSCIHTIGLMMIWGVRPIPQLIGKRNPKGRRKKVKYVLSKD
ncbi:unnamed protein product, partial [Rotaria sordida]